jgi:4-diphosphocytidyl-2-C-methyl-D-erythritol kinase
LLQTRISSITQLAHAKLNLFLHVVGVDKDGLHKLESLIVFTELHDLVSIEEADTLELYRRGPFADKVDAKPEEDIIVQAASSLGKLVGITPKVKISVTKNIPVSAGLGGGSSDAAATLKSLCQYWGIETDRVDVKRLALTLGADVPACFHGKEAIMRGVGEIIIPATLPKRRISAVLVKPRKSLSTRSVFEHFEGPLSSEQDLHLHFEHFESLLSYLFTKTNSLTASAQTLCCDIEHALISLRTSSGCTISRLSGSGPTCFGLFASEKNANEAAAKIALANPDWWVTSTAILKKTSAVPVL